jgi:hypothetical protein
MTRSIGGVVDYARLAELNRPTDENALRREVLVLSGRGLTEQDIGRALKLDPTAVRRLLIEATP